MSITTCIELSPYRQHLLKSFGTTSVRLAAIKAANVLRRVLRDVGKDTDIQKVLALCNANVTTAGFEHKHPRSGRMIRQEDGSFLIRVPKSASRKILHHTILHELGHTYYMRERTMSGFIDTNKDYCANELFCEVFAATFFITKSQLATYFDEPCFWPTDTIGIIDSLANKIDITTESLLIAMKAHLYLDKLNLAFIHWQKPDSDEGISSYHDECIWRIGQGRISLTDILQSRGFLQWDAGLYLPFSWNPPNQTIGEWRNLETVIDQVKELYGNKFRISQVRVMVDNTLLMPILKKE